MPNHVIWPSQLRRTQIRVHWFQRLASLPPGLFLDQIAEQLDEPYPSVARWATLFQYPFIARHKCRRGAVDWNQVNWNLSIDEIARQHGITSERVRQVRRAIGDPRLHSTDGITTPARCEVFAVADSPAPSNILP